MMYLKSDDKYFTKQKPIAPLPGLSKELLYILEAQGPVKQKEIRFLEPSSTFKALYVRSKLPY